MILTRDSFPSYISEYTEEELFYKELYRQKTQYPETFDEYLASLDMNYIKEKELLLPDSNGQLRHPSIERNFIISEQHMFRNMYDEILFSKHFRYSPEFQHEHEYFEILCVYQGRVPTTIQGVEHEFVSGDICIIPPNTTHSVGVFDDSIAFNLLIRASTFQGTFFQILTTDNPLAHFFTHVLYQKTTGNFLIFHTGEDHTVRDLLTDMYVEYLSAKKYRRSFLYSMLMLLWSQLLRDHESHMESILSKDNRSSAITDILNYISLYYQTASLVETAEHFGYSTAHFSTLIKKSTGKTFSGIVKEIKLQKARRALLETNLTIQNICELVGYENPEHFMRTFKKMYGITPSQYRKQMINNTKMTADSNMQP